MRFAMALLPFLATLATAMPVAAVPPAAAAHYDFAYAYPTCAPWDGSAWEFVLQTRPPGPPGKDGLPAPAFPSYTFRLWRGQPPVGRWLAFDQAWEGRPIGSLAERRSASSSRNVAGRVLLRRHDDKGFAGELHLSRPGGGELVLPFEAPKIRLRVFCG